MRILTSTLAIGLISGFLFFIHALIPYSHAWPLIWPLLGGVVAVILAARRHRIISFWKSLKSSIKTGAYAGLIFLIFTVAALHLLTLPELKSAANALGSDGTQQVTAMLVVSLAAVSVLGIVVSAVAGAFTFPVLRQFKKS